MKSRRIHVEHLLGRSVHDIAGRRLGRIEEIKAEQSTSGCFITGFVLGEPGLLQRLSFAGIAPLFFPSLAAKRRVRARTIPWQKMDLSNPLRPRLRCTEEELFG
jgi:sporulation protein YlmC with PRC-barrel domain